MRLFSSMLAIVFVISLVGCLPPEDPAQVADKPADAERERIKAEVGVGKEGQVIGEKEGFLRTPAKALFSTKQRVVFEMQIPQALSLYKAEHGYLPKSHDEFMSTIIEFNKIKLPELPEGQVYIWDAEQGQLMVDKPKE